MAVIAKAIDGCGDGTLAGKVDSAP